MSEPNDTDRALLEALRKLPHLDSMAALPLIAAHRELAREDALREAVRYVRGHAGPEGLFIGVQLQNKFQVKL